MSAIAGNLRRQRLPLMAISAALLLAGLVWLSLTYVDAPSSSTSEGVAAPGVQQPEWKLDVSLEGRVGKLTKSDKAAFNRARPQVVGLVQRVYDGLFLAPGIVDEVVADAFTKDAAVSLKKAGVGLPANTTDVRVMRRSARIGLEASGSRHAAVDVRVVASGDNAGKVVKVKHFSTLWLERQKDRWQVIGFEVNQRPLR